MPRGRRDWSAFSPWLHGLLPFAVAWVLRAAIDPWAGTLFPFLFVYAAVTYATWRGGVWPAVLGATLSFLPTLRGYGGFGDLGGSDPFTLSDGRSLTLVVTYVLACAALIAFVAALRRSDARLRHEIDEHRSAREALARLNATLEEQVAQRTRALMAADARLRTVFDTSYQYQALLAPDGRLLDANPASLAAIGDTLEGLQGRPFRDLPWFVHTPGAPERVQQGLARVGEGDTVREEIALELPQGRRVFDLALRPVREANGRVSAIVAEAIDITGLREAEAQLLQGQRIEAIGQLSGGVAHDFNNLLTVISGGLDLLARNVEPARAAAILVRMREAVQRGSALCRQLLAFSRRQALSPGSIDLRERIPNLRELLDRSLRGDVEVRTELAPDLWHVRADAGELELVLLNLAVNARDAMPAGGVIRISAHNVPAQGADAGGDRVAILVRDGGVGMTAEVLARAIEPFFSTKPLGQGTGLGLAQAHAFALASGGSLEIDSRPGEGTTVRLLLPRSNASTEADARVAPAAPQAGGADPKMDADAAAVVRRLLLVEDDPEVAALTIEMLRSLGIEVTCVAAADAALGALAHGRPFDCVLVDVMLPGAMNGVQLAGQIRQRRPELPVVLTTGNPSQLALAGPVPDWPLLPKPYELEQLRAVIEEACQPVVGA